MTTVPAALEVFSVGRDRWPAWVRWIVSGNAHGWWVIARGANDPIAEGLPESAAHAIADALNKYRGMLVLNVETVSAQQAHIGNLVRVLAECREYFDNKSDAEDWPPRQNTEMRMCSLIDSVLSADEREPHPFIGDDDIDLESDAQPLHEPEYEHEQELERQAEQYEYYEWPDGPQDEGFA